jgi:hypothetical protein
VTVDSAPFWLFGGVIVAGLMLIATGIWGIEKKTTEYQLRWWPPFPAHRAETVASLPHAEIVQEEMQAASRRNSRIALIGSGMGLVLSLGPTLLL